MKNRLDSQKQSGLVRALGPIDATMIVIGSMIGSGIFITSAESSRLSGAPGWLLLAWALAGLLTITGALCCSELATMMPRAGGVYVFLREAYGRSIGFLYGWTLFLVIQTGTIAAVAIAFAKFLGVFVPSVSPDHYLVAPISFGGYAISLSTEQLVAIALIALLTWSNTRGLEVGKIIQNTFTFAKTAALAAVVVIGLSLGWNANSAALSSAWWDSWANGWDPQIAQPGLKVVGGLALALLFGRSMVGPLFAQTAWTNVTFVGSEVREPGKNLVRALVGGCGIVVVLYLLANLAYLAVLPLTEIEHAPQNRVAVAMLNAVFGHPGAMCMAAAIMISTFGCDNGLILAGVYNQLLEYIVSADLLFYVLMIAALMVLRRKRPNAERPCRTWGYPFVPIISILLAGLLMVDLAFLAPATSGIGMLLVLTGVPVYFFWRRFRGVTN
ncbi:MAG: amino acid transporter [Verrucomicrobia bacterium]|nr:MAG: amino acid transporter [Verrucomicrobiota bacterium]